MGDVAAEDNPVVELGDVVVLVDAIVANLWCYLWANAPLLAAFCGLGLAFSSELALDLRLG